MWPPLFLILVELQKGVTHASIIHCMLLLNHFRLHALFLTAPSTLHPLIAATMWQKISSTCYTTPLVQCLASKRLLVLNVPARHESEIASTAMKAGKGRART